MWEITMTGLNRRIAETESQRRVQKRNEGSPPQREIESSEQILSEALKEFEKKLERLPRRRRSLKSTSGLVTAQLRRGGWDDGAKRLG
jgi:hypothetical protein